MPLSYQCVGMVLSFEQCLATLKAHDYWFGLSVCGSLVPTMNLQKQGKTEPSSICEDHLESLYLRKN